MATRTISVAGGNFNATSAWDEAVVPVAGDAVVARGGGDSGNLTVNVASGGVGLLSFVMTNYTGILTMNATLTVSGTVTLVSGMGTIAGTSDLICNTTATLTSGGKTLTGGLQLKGTSQTYTLADNWSVTGLLTCSGATQITITGSFTITVAGGVTITTATATGTGTPTISMTGGTLSGAATLNILLIFTSGTCTLSGSLTVSKSVTYVGGTLAGASTPILTLGASVTVNGFSGSTAATGQMQWGLTIGTQTITLASALNVNGTLTLSGTPTFSGAYGITCVACNITASAPTVTLSGTLTGTGDLTFTSVTSVTFAGDFAIQFATASTPGGLTITIVHDVTITGLTTITPASVINGAGKKWISGGLTTTAGLSGTADFQFSGGTWTGAAGTMSMPVFIQGDVTLSGTILLAGTTLTYVSGTITQGSSVLSCGSSLTIAGFGPSQVLHDWTITAAITVTINTSVVTFDGTLTMPNAAVTFAGTAGWTVGTFTNTAYTATRITTFTIANTYTVTTAISTESTDVTAEKHTWKSSSNGTQFYLTLGPGATQELAWVDATDIDSSLGQTIFSFRGAAPSNCINWRNTLMANLNPAWPTYQLGG